MPASAPMPTLSQIQGWDVEHLRDAATHWDGTAELWEDRFAGVARHMVFPGGTVWKGCGAEAAQSRAYADKVTVAGMADDLRAAAAIARAGADDIEWATQQALAAVADAQAAGFSVGEDLSVTGRQTGPLLALAARRAHAEELAAAIARRVQKLRALDHEVAADIAAAAAALDNVTFGEEPVEPAGGERDRPTVQLVDNHTVKGSPEPDPGTEPSPESSLFGDGAAPEPPPGAQDIDPEGSGLIGPAAAANPIDQQALDAQAATVDAARKSLADAQATFNAAARQAYMQGTGPGREAMEPLAQAVGDARADLSMQTQILGDLNAAAAAAGVTPVPVPALPANVDVQSVPAPHREGFADYSRALSEGSWGLIPDVAKDADTFTHWGQASTADRTQAVIDVASSVPIPGAKALGPLAGHGLEHLAADTVTHAGPVGHAAAAADDAAAAGDYAATAAAHAAGDAGDVAVYGIEDTATLLNNSELAGGHLIDRHVGQAPVDLAARLDATGLSVVSTFATADEAATAVSTALQSNRQVIDDWVANGMPKKLELDAPFNGGTVLQRGADQLVAGTSVKVVLKGDGNGGWYVLTGYLNP